jgi:hypothetical protein
MGSGLARAADNAAPLAVPSYPSVLSGPRLPTAPVEQDVSVWPPKPPDAVMPRQPVAAMASYSLNDVPPPSGAPPSVVMGPEFSLARRLVESTWYTRFDWYHWNETLNGASFVTENGPLFTLGYQRRIGSERFRAEIFGSQVHYSSQLVFNDGTTEPLSSQNDILGVRAEYDYLFQPDWPPPINFFVGIGTRAWIRNLPDFVTDQNTYVYGYQETWWTTYPYLGIETRHDESRDVAFYGRGRVGLVAITYEHLTLHDATLFPGPGVTAQAELGVRGERLFVAGFLELFTWRESGESRGLIQPSSTLLTVGLKSGLSF